MDRIVTLKIDVGADVTVVSQALQQNDFQRAESPLFDSGQIPLHALDLKS